MKKPRAKLARGFFQPLRSCLAVFYVEQVALNRHVYVQQYKEQIRPNTQGIAEPIIPSRTFPARQAGHSAFGKGRFRSIGGVMMLPTIVTIRDVHIIEHHRAQSQHDELSHVTDGQGRVKPIGFQRFPSGTILIGESRHIFPKNVA
jgi:hypothetical protein